MMNSVMQTFAYIIVFLLHKSTVMQFSTFGKTFLKYTLVEGLYQPSRLLTIGNEVTTPILPGFILNLEEVFADKL